MVLKIPSVQISGMEVFPIIEGGKGIKISDGTTAGHFALNGAVGTFSGANSAMIDEKGNTVPEEYHGKTRKEKHEELVAMGIKGGVAQAKIARDISGGKGPVHMNILWEMGGASRILHGVLERCKGIINGITCGAGMPYKLGEIASQYGVYYYPIVSSMRAFKMLWLRGYKNYSKLLGGVVYEDPWKAGGHNGLSNSESSEIPQDPYLRVAELRSFMNEVDLHNVPIIMAGGVWHIKDWEHWIGNPSIGQIAFQFGTRPLLTKESPIPDSWKKKLLTLKEKDVLLHRFSPTGFYSSSLRNPFIRELEERSARQVEFSETRTEALTEELKIGPRQRSVFINPSDSSRVRQYYNEGFKIELKTPSDTLIFVSEQKANQIREDQINCMGCLSACKFSNWQDHGDFSTGIKPDPRSFCIQKTLQNVMMTGDIDNELVFSGHGAFKFATDPFYKNGHIPSVKELVNRIMTGL